MDTMQLAAVAAIFLVAGAVKGLSGMGLPTVAMGLLGLAMPPAAAAALVVLPSLATNVTQCVGPRFRALVRRLWPLWAGLVLGALASPPPLANGHLLLGGVLVAYGGWGLARLPLPQPGRHERWLSPLVGLAGGVVTAMTGVFVFPLTPYLQTLRLEKDAMVQALGISFTLCTLLLASTLGRGTPLVFGIPGALALAAALAGMAAGARLRGRIDGRRFQQVLFGVFVAVGVVMCAQLER
jgi:uncharacterized protein